MTYIYHMTKILVQQSYIFTFMMSVFGEYLEWGLEFSGLLIDSFHPFFAVKYFSTLLGFLNTNNFDFFFLKKKPELVLS